MRVVARERWEAERDALGVTARIPIIEGFASFDPNAGGPRDPNPTNQLPPRAPRPAPVPMKINHLGGAVVAAVVAIGLAVASKFGATPLLAGVAGAQALLVVSWVVGTALPGRLGALVVGALAAGGADVVVSRWPHGQLGTLLVVLGLAIPVMFVHQLTRGVVRARVVESLSDIALMVVAVVAMAALVQLRHETVGALMVSGVMLAAGGALVAGHLVDMVWPVPRFDPNVSRGLLAVVVGAAVGAVATYVRLHNTVEFSGGRSLYLGASIGAIVSLFAVGMAFVEYGLPRAGRVRTLARPIAGTLIALGLVSPIGYLLCLIIRG
jgi:hypothetical protein